MDLVLQFLGTGNAFSRAADNYNNNALIRTEKGYIMIDCGSTAPQALHELGIKPWEILGVIITHMHGDHVGGLEQLIWERYYTGARGPGFLCTPVVTSASVMNQLSSYLEAVLNPFTMLDGSYSKDWQYNLVEPYIVEQSTSFVVSNVNLTLDRVNHVSGQRSDKPAYSVTIEGRTYYSSDTVFNMDNIERLANDPSITTIFHECSFSPRYVGTVHTHYEELLTLSDLARKKIVLMHHNIVPARFNPQLFGFRVAKRFESFQI